MSTLGIINLMVRLGMHISNYAKFILSRLYESALSRVSYKCTGECPDVWWINTPPEVSLQLVVVWEHRLAESIIELRQYNKPDVKHIKESVTVAAGTEAMLQSHKSYGKQCCETSMHVWKQPLKLKKLFPGMYASMNKFHCSSLSRTWTFPHSFLTKTC